MTDEQFRYLVKITRKRLTEETMNIQHSVKSGYHKNVSYLYGKADAFREMLFWLRGMSGDETDDAFR